MSRVYKAIIGVADKFVPTKLRPLWEHDAGPKTIFFWAPAFKWALVMASIDDYRRPLDKVSTTQSATLAATGIIWTRYCLGLVIAGLGDINRPPQSISMSQSGSLAVTGIIWSRYSLVIVPKNYSLFAVNVFVALTSGYQLARAIMYQQSLKDQDPKKKK